MRDLRAVMSCSHSADAPNLSRVHMQRDAYVMFSYHGLTSCMLKERNALIIVYYVHANYSLELFWYILHKTELTTCHNLQ